MSSLFNANKYLVVEEAIPKFLCDIVINYAKFQSFYEFTPEDIENAQVPNTHSRYADFLMEALLLHLHPIIEKNVEASLLPTYSYYRLYKKGDILKPHTDRNACEVSASVAFGWPQSTVWPFKLANEDEQQQHVTILLNPGDALIYAGPLVKHWRDPLESSAYVQAFFHYVYAEGSNAELKFDRRAAIGQPRY